MKKLCIYHGGCDDGFGAAYSVWKRYTPDVEFIAGAFDEPPPDVTGREVIMVDFSYKRPVLLKMIDQCASLLILDHHKTAEADLAGLHDPNRNINVFFDMNRSGAGMTWDYFFPNQQRPSLIEYVEDRDLWKKALYKSDEVTIALRSYPQDFLVWDKLGIGELVKEGTAILRYYRTLVEQMKKNSTLFNICGYTVPVVNAPHFMSSEVAGELSDGHPFAASYSIGANGKITYSLRSRDGGIDVSEIATAFGGGGHAQAAGFTSSTLIHN